MQFSTGWRVTFLGWNSYLTQCWNPLPLTFIDVNTKQLPTKWAVYPTPLDVLKLQPLRHFLLHVFVSLCCCCCLPKSWNSGWATAIRSFHRNCIKNVERKKVENWIEKENILQSGVRKEKNGMKCNAISNKLSYTERRAQHTSRRAQASK